MGDVVERRLDEGVAELRELLGEDVLREKEVASVVKKRRVLEHRMTSRAATAQDFLRAIQYELHLQLLVRRRMLALGIKRAKASGIDAKRAGRIIQIYNRAVSKFRSDPQLWMAYARHCARNGSARATNKVFARALAVCPDCEYLWIHASAWQMDNAGDVGAARSIAQRGLRHVPGSIELRLSYFRIELAYLARLRKRRETLLKGEGEKEKKSKEKISNSAAHEEEDNVDKISPVDVETKQDTTAAEDDEQSEASAEFFRGAVPLVVFKDSLVKVAQAADKFAVGIQLLRIAQATPYSPPELLDTMTEHLITLFPDGKREIESAASGAELDQNVDDVRLELADGQYAASLGTTIDREPEMSREIFREKLRSRTTFNDRDSVGSSWIDWEVSQTVGDLDSRVTEIAEILRTTNSLGSLAVKSILQVELSNMSPGPPQETLQRIRKYFQIGVDRDQEDLDLWVQWYKFERELACDFKRAQAIYWRATKNGAIRHEFDERCRI